MANILIKRHGKLVELGEGAIYRKSELKMVGGKTNLTEDDDALKADIGQANSPTDALQKSVKMLNQHSNAESAVFKASEADGNTDGKGGEGMTMKISQDDISGANANAIKDIVKNPNYRDVDIEVTRTNESYMANLRKTSIPFSKSELSEFLKTI